jgi:hypothetical protein
MRMLATARAKALQEIAMGDQPKWTATIIASQLFPDRLRGPQSQLKAHRRLRSQELELLQMSAAAFSESRW